MSDDQETKQPTVPTWQRDANSNSNSNPDSQPTPNENEDSRAESKHEEHNSLAVAKRFLQDEQVATESREKKIAFLKAKGIKDEDIETLLGSEQPSSSGSSTSQTIAKPTTTTVLPIDRAPIVTYPEFLSPKPTTPAPLLTPTTILRTIQSTAIVGSLIYGTSRFLLNPMLDTLNSSRFDFHTHTAQKLDSIVSCLESTVSVIPVKREDEDPSASEDDGDPTEMFHRDIGTQTIPPVSSSSSAAVGTSSNFTVTRIPSESQAYQLESLNRSLKDICDGLKSQSEDFGDVKATIDVFRDDLDNLTYRSSAVEVGGYGSSSLYKKKAEPEDEAKKARDNIRRIKGVLLSTRSFPVSTR